MLGTKPTPGDHESNFRKLGSKPWDRTRQNSIWTYLLSLNFILCEESIKYELVQTLDPVGEIIIGLFKMRNDFGAI